MIAASEEAPMLRFPFALALFALLLAPVACGRKKTPPPAVPATNPAATPTTSTVPAPKGVPEELKSLVDREWPEILREGEAFLEKFKEAQEAQQAGDRMALDGLIEEANQHFQAANDGWAEIYYWVQNAEDDGDLDAESAELCRRFLATYNKQVDGWGKKNKVLKEFSRVK